MKSIAFAMLVPAFCAQAQIATWESGLRPRSPLAGTYSAFPLSGFITGVERGQLSNLRVELIEIGTRIPLAESMVSGSGSFSFRSVPHGVYELRVSNLLGGIVHSREIHSGENAPLEMRLSGASMPALPPISMRRLQHKVPKEAARRMAKAEKLFRDGKAAEARALVEEAVAVDPDYFEALSNLGALELLNNETTPAIRHLEHALEIEPAAYLVAANLAAAHLLESHLPRAEECARQCLRYQPGFSRGRYLLAISLLRQNRESPEALGQLEKAQADFPAAGQLLRQLRP
jgi:tetratricopeptide (TPR) repeat protein